jgi:hypothetical protein
MRLIGFGAGLVVGPFLALAAASIGGPIVGIFIGWEGETGGLFHDIAFGIAMGYLVYGLLRWYRPAWSRDAVEMGGAAVGVAAFNHGLCFRCPEAVGRTILQGFRRPCASNAGEDNSGAACPT